MKPKPRVASLKLSGGQKRFVELVKIAHSQADLALIDEPDQPHGLCNKDAFIGFGLRALVP